MSRLLDLLTEERPNPRLVAIAHALEQGETPQEATSREIVASLVAAGLGDPLGRPLVHSAPPRPKLRAAASESALVALFLNASRPDRLALSAGLLQTLDFWTDSHEAAQEADDLGESAFSPYWHAIAHRREPDPGNAAYWFRRVGRHPVFAPLGEWVTQHHPGTFAGATWDPIAFVKFCEAAARDPEKIRVARSIQRAEMILLLNDQIEAVAGSS